MSERTNRRLKLARATLLRFENEHEIVKNLEFPPLCVMLHCSNRVRKGRTDVWDVGGHATLVVIWGKRTAMGAGLDCKERT